MSRARSRGVGEGEAGTASVELIAVIPFLLLALLAAAQIALAATPFGRRASPRGPGARAALVGGDATAAARRALPESMRDGAVVEEGEGVSVRVAIPTLLPRLPRVMVGARSGLGGEGG